MSSTEHERDSGPSGPSGRTAEEDAALRAARTQDPPRPRRALVDVAANEGLTHLVDPTSEDRLKIQVRDFPELDGTGVSLDDLKNIQVVLFDAKSVDSFVACFAAWSVLRDQATYIGITRTYTAENIFDDLDIARGSVVVMLDVSWSCDAMHDFAYDTELVYILETHSPAILELANFNYPNVIRIFEVNMSVGCLAWNFFRPSFPVPALLRAIEDTELGRHALKNAEAFADGFQSMRFCEPVWDTRYWNDPCFADFDALIGEDGGESVMAEAIECGVQMQQEIQEQCQEAATCYSVHTLKEYPSWLCAVVNYFSPFDGRVAEHLVANLAARVPEDVKSRCVAIVYRVTGEHVRAVVRSLPGGPDVSELAGAHNGSGREHKAFFSMSFALWERMWRRPVPILWQEVVPRGGDCLALRKGDLVTIAWHGERVCKAAPSERWSWGYRTNTSLDDPLTEGWIPTCAHTLYVAPTTQPEKGAGASGVQAGDLVVGHQELGLFVWGQRFRAGKPDDAMGWFHLDSLRP
eukprot:CAMPEP_0178444244 /NCGR_PEP_ID=MMETSP0689_2-20121128/39379_1 /TAXON_ID=160604 /ORGANISM="Amphidinium massartii, Strain CS-259" /LENGTH=521 /DNA_ID=CAMNT_0020068413 /DNA_START=159 /DNA_END=1721 /DNA_ORIENTATION=+